MSLAKYFVPVLLMLVVWTGMPSAQQQPSKIKVVIAPFVDTCEPRFTNADKRAIRAAIDRISREYLEKTLADAGYATLNAADVAEAAKSLGLDFEKEKYRNLSSLTKLGRALEAGFVVLVYVTDCSQENADNKAILGNLGSPQSTSRAKIRIWLADVPGNKLVMEGPKAIFEGEAKGPFFGTTKRSEMSGNPQDIAFMIMQENKRRSLWLGKAASEALFQGLSGVLGLKLRP